jgi:hypothetical protein
MTFSERFTEGQQMFAPLFKRLAAKRANEIAAELLASGETNGAAAADPNVKAAIRDELLFNQALENQKRGGLLDSIRQQLLVAQIGRTNAETDALVNPPPLVPWQPPAAVVRDGRAFEFTGPKSGHWRDLEGGTTDPTPEQIVDARNAGFNYLRVNGRWTLRAAPKPADVSKEEMPHWQEWQRTKDKPTPEALAQMLAEVDEANLRTDEFGPDATTAVKFPAFRGLTNKEAAVRLARWLEYAKGNAPDAGAGAAPPAAADFWSALIGQQVQPPAAADVLPPLSGAGAVQPSVRTKADFDALPSGATYTGKNGRTYRKP